MASARPVDVDECAVCYNLLKDPRVLKCRHSFCLKCLQQIENERLIECPLCRVNTTIKKGFSVKLLPRYVPQVEEKKSQTVELLGIIDVDKQVVSVAIDELSQVIYVGRSDYDKPIEMFSYDGSSVGKPVGNKLGIWAPRLAIDTRRGLLLAASGKIIYLFNRDGVPSGTITCPQFQALDDITYDVRQDRYIVVDVKARCIRFVDPETRAVTRTIPPEEEDELLYDNNTVRVASDKSGKSSMFVTTDLRSSAVRLYDGDGLHVKGYKSKGPGYGQFDHPRGVGFNADGQVIVSDSANHRLVCLSPDAAHDHHQWSVLADLKTHNIRHPRAIDITSDGIMAVVYWSQLEGPFKIAVFNVTDR